MPLIDSHTPIARSGRIPYTLSWSTRFGRDILDDPDVRRIMLDALDATADTSDATILSVATTSNTVRCHVLAPASLSPSTLLGRLKNAAARAISEAHPRLVAAQGAVFRRIGQVEPFVPESFRVPHHAEHASSVPESLAVSTSGTDSSGHVLACSAHSPHGASHEA